MVQGGATRSLTVHGTQDQACTPGPGPRRPIGARGRGPDRPGRLGHAKPDGGARFVRGPRPKGTGGGRRERKEGEKNRRPRPPGRRRRAEEGARCWGDGPTVPGPAKQTGGVDEVGEDAGPGEAGAEGRWSGRQGDRSRGDGERE